ncbi:hypothetical protein [Enterovibrio norvegicus]|uniref:hypothetical protein n=1 Tax=Enterovibrio norvegicus TaxID=188144 RepID=UPI0024B1527C|nr:hypothetical protein [Enterovibrio norvegicus]
MITVKGCLTDATGEHVLEHAFIEFVARRSAGEVLAYAGAFEQTDMEGNYHFSLKSGEYDVYAQVNRRSDVEPLGPCTVLPGMTGEYDIEALLEISAPILPETVIAANQIRDQVFEKHEEVAGFHQTVLQKAAEVDAHASQTAQDRTQVRSDREQVASDKEDTLEANTFAQSAKAQIATDKADVEQALEDTQALAQTVSTQHDVVSDKAAAVAQDADEVSSMHEEANGFKNSASNSANTATQQAALAKDWAEKPVDNAVEPNAYSSKHWAIKSANFASSASNSFSGAAQAKNDVETLKSETEDIRDEALQARSEIQVLATYENALWSLIHTTADQAIRQFEHHESIALIRSNKLLDANVRVIRPIYRTAEIGAYSTSLLELGLNAQLAVCSVFISTKDTDHSDHFNLQIGKGANLRTSWGSTFPGESVDSNATIITHPGDAQNVNMGRYGMYVPATIVLDENGNIPLAVAGNNASCGIAINITALIGVRR